MLIRRAFFFAQFGAVIVLPLWLLIGRGIIFGDLGWDLMLLVIAAPVLALFMALILGLSYARASVRRQRALSWPDVAVLAVWYAAIIAAGFAVHNALAIAVIVVAVMAFWIQLWQLFVETRVRVNRALGRMGQAEPGVLDHGDYEVIRVESDS